MEIDVENIEQRPNVLLRRTEVRFRVAHDKETTPKREDLREALAELMNVKKDQVIARLEYADVEATLAKRRANLEMARAALEQVEATLNEAALDFERQSKLYVDQAIISKAEYDLSEAKYKRAIANVASAKAAIEVAKASVTEAEVEVENTRIRVPFDGTVLAKNADIGEVVAPLTGSASSPRRRVP